MKSDRLYTFAEYVMTKYTRCLNELLLWGLPVEAEIVPSTTALEQDVLWLCPDAGYQISGYLKYSGDICMSSEDEEGFTHTETRHLSCLIQLWAYRTSDGFEIEIDRVRRKAPIDENHTILDTYLIPKYNFTGVSQCCESILLRCTTLASQDKCVPPKQLASVLGLRILYYDLYGKSDKMSLLITTPTDLQVVEEKELSTVRVYPGTVIINTHHKDYRFYEDNCIAHECYHYVAHDLTITLQTAMQREPHKVLDLVTDHTERENEQKSAIKWMEAQSKLGADLLRYPIRLAKRDVQEALPDWSERNKNVIPMQLNIPNSGVQFEYIISRIIMKRGLPKALVRRVAIFAGYKEAKGAYTYVDRGYVPAFAFDTTKCQGSTTYVISLHELIQLCSQHPYLGYALQEGLFVYTEGHVCLNTPEYTETVYDLPDRGYDSISSYCCYTRERIALTEYARANVDECCIPFYIDYAPCCSKYYDEHFLTCDESLVRQQANIAKLFRNPDGLVGSALSQSELAMNLPPFFGDAVRKLRKQQRLSQEKLAERAGLSRESIYKIESNKNRNVELETVLRLAIGLKLDGIVASTFFRTAHFYPLTFSPQDTALFLIIQQIPALTLDDVNPLLKQYTSLNEYIPMMKSK